MTCFQRSFLNSLCARAFALLAAAFLLGLPGWAAGAGVEMIRDPRFQSGFYLLKPEQGTRLVYGQMEGFAKSAPVWDLAQWSSRLPLKTEEIISMRHSVVASNSGKVVILNRAGKAEADLQLAVNAGAEYLKTRKSSAEPWVHLLTQQDFPDPPSLAGLTSLNFNIEARLNRSVLKNEEEYSPALHAAQFFVYLTVGNRDAKSPGHHDCFWFGVPLYDNRHRTIPAYQAQDFGATRLFIFTPSSATFSKRSIQDAEWTQFRADLLPLMREGLEHAKAKGFIHSSSMPEDFRPLGIFIGWEVPGTFDVDLEIRKLSLKAVSR